MRKNRVLKKNMKSNRIIERGGGSAMEKIIFPEITLKYINEFLTEK